MGKRTILRQMRKPTEDEALEQECALVFERIDYDGREYTIYADSSTDEHGWFQWGGVPKEVLGDNVDDIERWYHGVEGMALQGVAYGD